MELHKAWISEDLINRAREDVLANKEKTFEKQNRINLSQIKTKAISDIAELCGVLAWHPWHPERSGAQIHDNLSKGESDQNWHQDISALQGMEGCTIWVPLDPIDGTRPTLMFGGEHPALSHHHDARAFSVAKDPPKIQMPILALNMNLGDVIMFSWSELHCTFWTSDMSNGRISLDLRFAP